MSISLEQARLAKRHLAAQLADASAVNGIGIIRDDGDYGLKVNLVGRVHPNLIPREVDGVRVYSDVVGRAYLASSGARR